MLSSIEFGIEKTSTENETSDLHRAPGADGCPRPLTPYGFGDIDNPDGAHYRGRAIKAYEFTVVVERDEDGRYVAVCPSLQGCYTEGETEAEAMELIRDAIRLHVEARRERGEPIYEEIKTSTIRVEV